MKISVGSLLEKDNEMKPITRPLKKDECNIDASLSVDNALGVYTVNSIREIIKHCDSYGYKIARSMREALIDRDKEVRSITLREADIATRAKLDLSIDGSIDFLLMNGSLLVEGFIGDPESGFELRRRYNRGKQWFSEFKDKAEASQLKKAEGIMEGIVNKLNAAGLRLWPNEVEEVFHSELLKPEWMTDAQYMDATRKHKLFKDA